MKERVAEGQRRYPALRLQVGSATELPYADGEFDLVTQFTCLSSILDDQVRLAVAGEMRRVAAGGWVLSFDMRGLRRPGPARKPPPDTPTVPIDEAEARRLFGDPVLLRKTGLTFELAQLTGWHTLFATALGALPPLRSHLLGLWRIPR
jgi:hypothetical protein